MSESESGLSERPVRVARQVEIRLKEPGRPDVVIGTDSHTVNVSRNGLLMEIPRVLDAVAGQEIAVCMNWEGKTFETGATIVRFESPYHGNPQRQVMALGLAQPLPEELIGR